MRPRSTKCFQSLSLLSQISKQSNAVQEPDDEESLDLDFSGAWSHPHAYALIKAAIFKIFMERDDFNPENPYESLIGRVATTGMIRSAYDLDKRIEVRYGWELLDDNNIIMHSCFGYVDKVDVRINAEDMGFMLDLGDGDYGVFAYKNIFWVCEAEE
jgi:hypothetical protein